MVKAMRLVVTAIVALLALDACQVAFIGVFPPTSSQMTARTDLSAQVAAGPAASFNLAIVSAGGSEYVLLFSSAGFDPAQTHLVVLDSQLRVISAFTNAELYAAASSYLLGQYAMADANSQVVVGNIRFTASQTGFLATGTVAAVLWQPSLVNLGANEANFSASGGAFSYTEYDSAWLSLGSRSVPLGAPSTSINLVGAFTDPDSLSAPIVFMLQDYGSQQSYFLSIPKDDIAGTNLSTVVTTSVFATFNPFSKSTLDPSTACYSHGNIIAYDHQSEALVRFPLDDPSNVSSLPLISASSRRVAAGISGTYCVVWDADTRELTRYEQWW
jgi:hypothetical protein